jgi:hypothetical protein
MPGLPLQGQDILYYAGKDLALNSLYLIDPSAQVLGRRTPVVPSGAATVTITKGQTGSTFLFDTATGVVYTLPAPLLGLTFDFVVTVAVTSNSYKVITDAGTTYLLGSVDIGVVDTTPGANPGPKYEVGDGSANIAVTMNGTTTGGLVGTRLQFICVTATKWAVNGVVVGSGTIATPFANS